VKNLPLFLIAIFLYACTYVKSPSSNEVAPIVALTRVDPVLFSDTSVMMTRSVNEVYASSGFRTIWFDTTAQRKAYADSLISFITEADILGLDPADYHLSEILRLVNDTVDIHRFIKADVLLTDAFFTLSSHIAHGRINFTDSSYVDLRETLDEHRIAFLKNDLNKTSPIAELKKREPVSLIYRAIKDTLMALTKLPHDTVTIKKINQLKANVEYLKARKPTPAKYAYVNIPSYQLRIIENDSVTFESKVVVGKQETPTRQLRSTITYFIIYPYWHVPRSIATKELLPLIQKDSTYLNKHNYEVLDRSGTEIEIATIPWATLTVDNFPYTLRQREGNENTLGVIKFHFNNKYGIYLHDTNGRRSFSKSMRALSHGCVRVHKARELAKYLVRNDSVYVTPDDLDQYFDLKDRLKVPLRESMPLVIDYFTCELIDGRIRFYEDIYGYDKKILSALAAKKRSKSSEPAF
jgi:L,D-transpeptidase YcbB